MKTKTVTVTKELPLINVYHDSNTESPRTYQDNLGYFLEKSSRYQSPDGKDSEYYNIMLETGDQATSTDNHIELMKMELGDDILAIYPVSRYEHSSVAYKLGEYHGFDYSNSAFYIVTKDTYRNIVGTEEYDEVKAKEIINQELEQYTAWCNGEVFGFYSEENEEHYGDFYSIEELHQAVIDELGDDWKDENMHDYMQ